MDCARLKQTGRIIRVADGHADIAFDALASCAGCQGRCGIALISGLLRGGRRSRMRLPLDAGLQVAVGERVMVSIAAGRLLWLVFLTYGVPLFGLVPGAALASLLWPDAGDPVAIIGALAGAAIAMMPVLVLRRRQPSAAWLGTRIMRAA